MGKKLNFWYGGIFGSYWMIYAVVASFASVFLLGKGYSNSQIGVTLAAANILAVIMQPITADIADRSKKIGVIGLTSIMTLMMMAFTLGLFFFKGGSPGLCVMYVLLIAWHTVLQPMFNALTFRLEEAGYDISFGIARSVGSLAYSILVAILGTLVEHLGLTVIPLTSEVTCVMLLISLLLTKQTFDKAMKQRRGAVGADGSGKPSDGSGESGVESEKSVADTGEPDIDSEKPVAAATAKTAAAEPAAGEEEITLVQFIKRNKLFFVLNLAVIGIFFSNATLNNYMVQIVTEVGGTSEDMGRILGLMAFLEIPTMVLFSRIKRRFSCQLLLKVASVGFTIKILMCWLARSVAMLFVAQAFQLVSFALFLPAMVYFTGEIMSKGEAVKGQALFTTMITVTTIFASLLGGWILDVSGARMLTMVATIATAAGAVLVFAVIDRIGRENR